MTQLTHSSAKPEHYDFSAKDYDAFNEVKSQEMNAVLNQILTDLKVARVADMTCGTGSQVFFLRDRGFEIEGSDINKNMLDVAQTKAKEKGLDLRFTLGDIRTARLGTFDVVLSIFNAVGHLTKEDFAAALKNVRHNLALGGYFIFDIFNLDYMLHDDNITKLTIDWIRPDNGGSTRLVQYSTVDHEGILASHTTRIGLYKNKPLELSNVSQTLQIYTQNQLKHMLEEAGFSLERVCDDKGQPFEPLLSQRMLIVARVSAS